MAVDQNSASPQERKHASSPTNLGHATSEPIAVIGFAHKLPQDVTSADSLWSLLVERRTTMTEVPTNRWNIQGFYRSHGNRPSTVCDTCAALGFPFSMTDGSIGQEQRRSLPHR